MLHFRSLCLLTLVATLAFVPTAVTAGPVAVVVGEDGRILRSDNGGLTWASQPSGDAYSDLNAIALTDGATGWAGGNTFSDRHCSDGETWVKDSQDPGTPAVYESAVALPGTNTVVAVGRFMTSDGGGGAISRSTDGGATMSHTIAPGVLAYLRDVDFCDSQHGWAAASAEIYRSTDGGLSWGSVNDPRSDYDFISAIDFANPTTGFIVYGTSRRAYKTVDSGLSWTEMDLYSFGESSFNLQDVFFVDASHGWVVGEVSETGYLKYTTDGGTTWSDKITFADNLVAVEFFDATTGIAVGENTIFRTTDGGLSWTAVHTSGDKLTAISTVVPEPTSLAMLALGAGAALRRRRT